MRPNAKFLALCAILALLPHAAVAQEPPKWREVDGWQIHIDTSVNGCFMISAFDDGYFFRTGFNKKAAGRYMVFGNEAWKSLANGGQYNVDVQFDSERAWSLSASGVNMSGLPVLVVNFEQDRVVQEMAAAESVGLRYAGEEIARLSLGGPRAALSELERCQRIVDAAAKEDAATDPFARPASPDPFRR